MDECRKDDGESVLGPPTTLPTNGLRVEGPAGCGKTFIALRFVIEELQRGGRPLRLPACAARASVAKWIYRRVGQGVTEALRVLAPTRASSRAPS